MRRCVALGGLCVHMARVVCVLSLCKYSEMPVVIGMFMRRCGGALFGMDVPVVSGVWKGVVEERGGRWGGWDGRGGWEGERKRRTWERIVDWVTLKGKGVGANGCWGEEVGVCGEWCVAENKEMASFVGSISDGEVDVWSVGVYGACVGATGRGRKEDEEERVEEKKKRRGCRRGRQGEEERKRNKEEGHEMSGRCGMRVGIWMTMVVWEGACGASVCGLCVAAAVVWGGVRGCAVRGGSGRGSRGRRKEGEGGGFGGVMRHVLGGEADELGALGLDLGLPLGVEGGWEQRSGSTQDEECCSCTREKEGRKRESNKEMMKMKKKMKMKMKMKRRRRKEGLLKWMEWVGMGSECVGVSVCMRVLEVCVCLFVGMGSDNVALSSIVLLFGEFASGLLLCLVLPWKTLLIGVTAAFLCWVGGFAVVMDVLGGYVGEDAALWIGMVFCVGVAALEVVALGGGVFERVRQRV
ncbi:uncharacterized protein MONOS_18452 [Monocercomonoides exilis]|uniref:uncharacterized protein n=1 Tax=Monocercomonoides exilis TaxID=2049356 RepID=UPI00355A9F5B|nr:hypothetical protein MONOS_18452 [Monocercomonoides exilis]